MSRSKVKLVLLQDFVTKNASSQHIACSKDSAAGSEVSETLVAVIERGFEAAIASPCRALHYDWPVGTLEDFVKRCVSLLPPGFYADFQHFGEKLVQSRRCVSVSTLFSGTDGVVDAMKAGNLKCSCQSSLKFRLVHKQGL